MSTSVSPPSNSPPAQHATQDTLVALLQKPRKALAWVSVTPNWLRTAIVANVLLSVILALAIRQAAEQQIQTLRTIQKDSAPSIVAGQRMRASLADMHSDLANELLVEPGKGRQAIEGFNKRLGEAAEALRNAAQNITYPGEVQPVETVLNELPHYMELAGRARVLHDQENLQFVAQHQAADDIMRTKLTPAIITLIDVNQHELDAAYKAEKTAAMVDWLLVLLFGTVQVAAIIGLKILLFKRMRRVFNPLLIPASAVTACGCLWALVALWESSANIKVGKEDAFDSIKVLEAARAAAYDANGDESRWLLVKGNHGDPSQIKFYADDFHRKAKQIEDYSGPASDSQLRAEIERSEKNTQKAPAELQGYLAVELNNITFQGELEAAEDTLLKFLAYLKIDQRIRELKDEKEAIALCVGTQPGQSNWAFDRFDAALNDTIKINRDQFDNSLASAASSLAGLDWLLPLGLALSVSLLTFMGLRPRLHEYEIA